MPLWWRRPLAHWAASARAESVGCSKWFFPSIRTGETTSRAHSVGPPSTRQTITYCSKSSRGSARGLRASSTWCMRGGWLRELGLFSLQKRRLKGHLLAVYSCLLGECIEDGSRLFLEVYDEKTKGNRHKLQHGKFWLNTRTHFSTMRVVKHWNSLSREVLKSPSSKTVNWTGCISKQPALIWLPLKSSLDQIISRGPF